MPHTQRSPKSTKDDVFLLWVAEVADILDAIATFAVRNATARFADAGHPGSVAVRELSDLRAYQVDELKGKVVDDCHDASVDE